MNFYRRDKALSVNTSALSGDSDSIKISELKICTTDFRILSLSLKPRTL